MQGSFPLPTFPMEHMISDLVSSFLRKVRDSRSFPTPVRLVEPKTSGNFEETNKVKNMGQLFFSIMQTHIGVGSLLIFVENW